MRPKLWTSLCPTPPTSPSALRLGWREVKSLPPTHLFLPLLRPPPHLKPPLPPHCTPQAALDTAQSLPSKSQPQLEIGSAGLPKMPAHMASAYASMPGPSVRSPEDNN